MSKKHEFQPLQVPFTPVGLEEIYVCWPKRTYEDKEAGLSRIRVRGSADCGFAPSGGMAVVLSGLHDPLQRLAEANEDYRDWIGFEVDLMARRRLRFSR